jgi:hypothetical protein
MPYPSILSIVMAESRKLVSDSYFQGFCGGTCRSRPHTSIFPFVVLSLRASSCQKSPHHAAGEAPLPKDSCHDSQGDLTVLKAIEEPDQTLTSRQSGSPPPQTTRSHRTPYQPRPAYVGCFDGPKGVHRRDHQNLQEGGTAEVSVTPTREHVRFWLHNFRSTEVSRPIAAQATTLLPSPR